MDEMINKPEEEFKEILDVIVDFSKPESKKAPLIKELSRHTRSRDSSSELGQPTGDNRRTASTLECSDNIRQKSATVSSSNAQSHINHNHHNNSNINNNTNSHHQCYIQQNYQHNNTNSYTNNNNTSNADSIHHNERRNFHNHNDIIDANNTKSQHLNTDSNKPQQNTNNFTHSHNNNKNTNNHLQFDKLSTNKSSLLLTSSTPPTVVTSTSSKSSSTAMTSDNHVSRSGSKSNQIQTLANGSASLSNQAKFKSSGPVDSTLIINNNYSTNNNSELQNHVKPASNITSNVNANTNYPSSTINSGPTMVNYISRKTQRSDDDDNIHLVEMEDLGKTAELIEPNEREKYSVTLGSANKNGIIGPIPYGRTSANRFMNVASINESLIPYNSLDNLSLTRNPLTKRDIKKRRKPEEKKMFADDIPGHMGNLTVDELTQFIENGNNSPSTGKTSQSNNRNRSNGNSSNNTTNKSNTKHTPVTTNTQPTTCNINNSGSSNASTQVNQNISSSSSNGSRPMKKKKKISNSQTTSNKNNPNNTTNNCSVTTNNTSPISSTHTNNDNDISDNSNTSTSTSSDGVVVANVVEPSKPRTYADIAKNSNPSPTSSTIDTSPQHTKRNSDASSTEVSSKGRSKQFDTVKDTRPEAAVIFENHLNFKEDDMCKVQFGFFDDITHSNSKNLKNHKNIAIETVVDYVESCEINNIKTSPINERYYFKDNINAKSFNYDQILKFISTAWEGKERNKSDIRVKS